MAIKTVVYVWIGTSIPNFARESFLLTKKFNKAIKQVLLTDDWKHCENVADLLDEIVVVGPDDLNVEVDLSDFWQSTKQRFDFLEYYMETKGIDFVFHAEVDNVIMRLDAIGIGEENFNRSLIYCPMDYSGRFIFSVGWLGLKAIKEFNRFRKRPSFSDYNDMELLSLFFVAGGAIRPLPADPIGSTYNYIPENIRFDAASVGQFLFGDAKGREHYVNPRSFPLDKTKLTYKDGVCTIDLKRAMYTYFNLHIHSKNFESV